jgi:hypothetical protein
MLGTDSPEVSGVAIRAKQNRGAMMIQVPLDNLIKTRQYLAEHILRLVQAYYTEERLIQVTDEDDPMKSQVPVLLNGISPEGAIVNDLTLGEYDVVIGTMPARDNYDEAQFAEAIELRQVGVPIPDDLIVDYSHLAKKGEIAKRIRQMQGMEPMTEAQAQIQQFQAEAEIKKIQLELAKMEAEVQNLQAQAQLHTAKAQETIADPQIKVAEIQSKMEMKQQELALRQQLSALTNEMRQGQTETQAAAKIATAAIKPSGGR